MSHSSFLLKGEGANRVAITVDQRTWPEPLSSYCRSAARGDKTSRSYGLRPTALPALNSVGGYCGVYDWQRRRRFRV